MKVKSESEVAQSCLTLSDPMDVAANQVPQSTGFCRQEYWSGLPLGIIGEYIFINLFLIQITQKIFIVLTLIKLADLLFCSLSTWNNSLINSC